MNWLLWFGLIVATWRVTRLLVKDEFPPTKAVRDWIIATFWREYGPSRDGTRWLRFWQRVGHSIAYVFTCHWCMSFWVGLALWGVAVWNGFDVALPWLMVAAASGLSGLIGTLEARIDQNFEEAERRMSR